MNELRIRARNVLHMKLEDNLVKLFRTDLNGEASFSMKKGKYFLFGIAQLAQNKIVWNLPVSIKKSDNYFELSNDNVCSIDNEDLINEIAEALKGLIAPE